MIYRKTMHISPIKLELSPGLERSAGFRSCSNCDREGKGGSPTSTMSEANAEPVPVLLSLSPLLTCERYSKGDPFST
jgi:hypothetical protein